MAPFRKRSEGGETEFLIDKFVITDSIGSEDTGEANNFFVGNIWGEKKMKVISGVSLLMVN